MLRRLGRGYIGLFRLSFYNLFQSVSTCLRRLSYRHVQRDGELNKFLLLRWWGGASLLNHRELVAAERLKRPREQPGRDLAHRVGHLLDLGLGVAVLTQAQEVQQV